MKKGIAKGRSLNVYHVCEGAKTTEGEERNPSKTWYAETVVQVDVCQRPTIASCGESWLCRMNGLSQAMMNAQRRTMCLVGTPRIRT